MRCRSASSPRGRISISHNMMVSSHTSPQRERRSSSLSSAPASGWYTNPKRERGSASLSLACASGWYTNPPPQRRPFLVSSTAVDQGGSALMLQLYCPACENVVWLESDAADEVLPCPDCRQPI